MTSAHDLRDTPICIDARMLATGGTGVSTYARSLLAATGRITDRPLRLQASGTGDGSDGRLRRWAGSLRGGAALRARGGPEGGVLEARDIFRRAHVGFGMRGRLWRLGCALTPGIMHWTYPVPLRMEGWINLYTVHDAIPLDRPSLTPIDPARHRAVLEAILATGDGIVTVSGSARRRIVAALGCDPAFVANAGQPVDVAGASAALPAGLERGGYLVAVGAIEPRKNLLALLAAYRESRTPLPLVIAGPDGWQAGPILAELARTPGAMRLPYLPRHALLGLVAGARALVFPSLAEGFGLPVAEAMALGTPVLAGNRDAPAEIAGDAALLVDPEDVNALAQAIVHIATDDLLAGDLARRGPARAAAFSTDVFERRLATVYRAALGDRREAGVPDPTREP